MEIHVQQCQFCDSRQVRNILFREEGEPDRVFVQCTRCDAFVASYVIAPMGYFHHGKGFKSFLRGIFRSGEFMSGRRVKDKFEKRKAMEQERFRRVLEELALKEKEMKDSKNSD
jgi:hypothetical protein